MLFSFSSAGLKKYFANTSWLLVEKIVRIIVGLSVGIYVARYLGAERFGLLSYAMSFVGLFSSIVSLGLDSIVVRDLVQNPEKKEKILSTAFWLMVMAALAVFGLITAIIHYTAGDSLTRIIILIIAATLIFQPFNVIVFYFQSKVLSKYTALAQFIQLIVPSCIKLVLVYLKASLIWFAATALVDGLVLVIGLLGFFCRIEGGFKYQGFNWKVGKTLLKDSWPLILAGVMVSIYMKVDQVMIKEMLGDQAVGNYAAAVKLSEGLYFLPMVIVSSLFPAIVGAKKTGEEFYRQRLQLLYVLMVWIAIAICLPTTYVSDQLILLLFGPDYAEAGTVLAIHIWATVFVFLGVASSQYLIVENMQKISLIRTMIGALANIMLNILLIPQYGISGAAIATLISYAIATFSLMLFKNTRSQGRLMFNAVVLVPVVKSKLRHTL